MYLNLNVDRVSEKKRLCQRGDPRTNPEQDPYLCLFFRE